MSNDPASMPPFEMGSGQALVDQIQGKMRQLVDDFAKGVVNRVQFHQLYDRYQHQISRLTEMLTTAEFAALEIPQNGEDTFQIKKRLTARVIGVSVYSNMSGLPIETLGDFAIDPALIVPMLSSYRAAAREIFKAGMRSTVMENDQWLCFVPGNYSTLIALFSVEPSQTQLNTLERSHRDFEDANKPALEKGEVDPSTLAYPFLTFIRRAKGK